MHAGFTALRHHCSMCVGVRVELHEWPDVLQRDVDRIATLFDDGLVRFGGPFLAGPRFTAVDAFFSPVAFRVQTYGIPLPPTLWTTLRELSAELGVTPPAAE